MNDEALLSLKKKKFDIEIGFKFLFFLVHRWCVIKYFKVDFSKKFDIQTKKSKFELNIVFSCDTQQSMKPKLMLNQCTEKGDGKLLV